MANEDREASATGFAAEALEEALRRIEKARAEQAVELDLHSLPLQVLPGELAALAALQTLNLRGCDQVADLQPLTGLTALQILDLSGCGQVADLQPLAGLTAPCKPST